MIKNYQHRRHNKNLLMVHIIIVTKYRKQLLTGELDHDIKRYIMEVCMRNHWYIKRMQSDKDHIHILLQYNPTDSITTIVSSVKQYSTYYAWKNHSSLLSIYYWKKKILWSNGYFAASVGQVSQSMIEHYIEMHG